MNKTIKRLYDTLDPGMRKMAQRTPDSTTWLFATNELAYRAATLGALAVSGYDGSDVTPGMVANRLSNHSAVMTELVTMALQAIHQNGHLPEWLETRWPDFLEWVWDTYSGDDDGMVPLGVAECIVWMYQRELETDKLADADAVAAVTGMRPAGEAKQKHDLADVGGAPQAANELNRGYIPRADGGTDLPGVYIKFDASYHPGPITCEPHDGSVQIKFGDEYVHSLPAELAATMNIEEVVADVVDRTAELYNGFVSLDLYVAHYRARLEVVRNLAISVARHAGRYARQHHHDVESLLLEAIRELTAPVEPDLEIVSTLDDQRRTYVARLVADLRYERSASTISGALDEVLEADAGTRGDVVATLADILMKISANDPDRRTERLHYRALCARILAAGAPMPSTYLANRIDVYEAAAPEIHEYRAAALMAAEHCSEQVRRRLVAILRLRAEQYRDGGRLERGLLCEDAITILQRGLDDARAARQAVASDPPTNEES